MVKYKRTDRSLLKYKKVKKVKDKDRNKKSYKFLIRKCSYVNDNNKILDEMMIDFKLKKLSEKFFGG